MKIKLQKNFRYYGEIFKAGSELSIKNKITLKYLKENGYIYEEKKEKKEKSKIKLAEENN